VGYRFSGFAFPSGHATESLAVWGMLRPAHRGDRASRNQPTRRYPYGYGRAEDVAGIAIVAAIWGSALLAGWQSNDKLVSHRGTSHLTLGMLAAGPAWARAMIGLGIVRRMMETTLGLLPGDRQVAGERGLTMSSCVAISSSVALDAVNLSSDSWSRPAHRESPERLYNREIRDY
jgi:cation efflux family protein